MIATPLATTDLELNIFEAQEASEGSYTTAPMLAVQPLYHLPDEENLHTSFENAISKRLILSYGRWGKLSLSPVSEPLPHYTTGLVEQATPLIEAVQLSKRSQLCLSKWQHHLIYSCLACIFMLSGFDLMGLMVLHIH